MIDKIAGFSWNHGSGIAVRAYSHPRLQDSIRISVGLSSDTDAVVAALGGWLAKQGAA